MIRPWERNRNLTEKIERDLRARGSPRLQMLFVVILTACSGFLASMFLLHKGMTPMVIRYPASIAVSYAAFLLLLRTWLRLHERRAATHLKNELERCARISGSPGGPLDGRPQGNRGGGAGEWLESLFEISEWGDSFAAVMLLVVMAAVLGFTCWTAASLLWDAPAILAELMLDFLLAGGLYRSLRTGPPRLWWGTAFRRTVLPFALIAAIASAGGDMLQARTHGAPTLAKAIHALRKE